MQEANAAQDAVKDKLFRTERENRGYVQLPTV